MYSLFTRGVDWGAKYSEFYIFSFYSYYITVIAHPMLGASSLMNVIY